MSIFDDINELITMVPVHTGYPPTDAELPYVVHRPLDLDPEDSESLAGNAFTWMFQTTLYCCAASAEASFNLALAVVGALQGARVAGTTLSTSIGYSSAAVEGDYESQVTISLNQGGL